MIQSWIDNCGKLIYFGAYNNQYCSVTKINNNPAISVNGQPVSTSSGMFFFDNKDTPWVCYQLYCGQVQNIGLQNAGYNANNPNFTCDGIIFGEPIIATGITRYNIKVQGSSFASTPKISIPCGVASPSMLSGYITDVHPKCENILGRGQITPGTPVTVSVGVGQNCNLIPIVVSGKIQSIMVPGAWGQNNGINYPTNVSVNIWDATGTGATGIANVQGGWIWNVKMLSQGYNYTNPIITLAPANNPIVIEAVVEPYLQYIPIISSAYFYNMPTIQCNVSGAQLIPVMKGVEEKDLITYSASDNWLVANNITVKAVLGVAVDNWYNKTENTDYFNIASFTGYMKVGVNLGEQSIYPALPNCPIQNKFLAGTAWSISNGGTIIYDSSNKPISWNNPHVCNINRWLYGPDASNNVDQMGSPNQIGEYLLIYDDPCVNTLMGSRAILGCNPKVAYMDIENLSGPNKGSYSGIVVDPQDIKVSNGSLSINLLYSSLGSGYEAALVSVSGAEGSQASFGTIIENGIITKLPTHMWGQNYTSKPTIKVYGLGRTGNTVSGIFNCYYVDNNPSRDLNVGLTISQISGLYLINNPWVTTPDPITLKAQWPDRNDRLATDISILYGLSGVDGVRTMDLTGGYGNNNNYVDDTDMIDSNNDLWNISKGDSSIFQFCRFINTDSGNTNYAWYTDRVYGSQDIFCDGTDSYGKYKLLPPNDNGLFTGNYGNWQCVTFQLRSTQPHTLKTGQYAWIGSNSNVNSVPVTNANNLSAGFFSVIWATDPYTIVCNAYIPGNIKPGTPYSDHPQTINSQQEINLVISGVADGWHVSTAVPAAKASAPFDYSKRLSQQLNCINYVNIPPAYNSGLISKLAKEISGSKEVYVEYDNEDWNGGNPMIPYIYSWNNLLGYIPKGESFGKYYVSTGQRPQFNVYGASIIMAAQAFDQLKAESNVEKMSLVIGSFFVGAYRTAEILENAQSWGIDINKIAVADYYTFPGDSTINSMMTPFGIKNAGGLPPDAINSLVRNYMFYNSFHKSCWDGHNAAISNIGQPVNRMELVKLSSSEGLFPNNNYTSYCTFSDSGGLETTVGLSKSFYVPCNSGNLLGVNLPAMPKWATHTNLYLSDNPNGIPYLYQSYTRENYYPGQVISLTGVWANNNINPPQQNFASGYIGIIPDLITYEGGNQINVPNFIPFANTLRHDCYADSSNGLLTEGWYRKCAYHNATMAHYYQAFGTPYEWMLTTYTGQVAGKGDKNLKAIAGYPADGLDHNDVNLSTGLYGLRQYINSRAAQTQIQPQSPDVFTNPHIPYTALLNYFCRGR